MVPSNPVVLSGVAVSVSESSRSWSTVKSGDMSPVVQGSVDDACEEPLCPR